VTIATGARVARICKTPASAKPIITIGQKAEGHQPPHSIASSARASGIGGTSKGIRGMERYGS
jgi:hypothetical protein